MLRRTFLTTSALATSALSRPAAAPQRKTAKRPNIVLIMADDMGFSDLGCYGSEIDTPVLNGLAEKGVRFTQFQNTARCCPTRAALLTGLYSHQAGIGHMVEDYGQPAYRGELNRQCVTIAEALKPAGYGTAIFGKYHVARNNPRQIANWPLQRGFDTFYGTVAGAINFFNPRTLVRGNTPIEPDKPDYYFTDAICDEAAEYVGSRGRGNQQPFFLYLAQTAPHWPMHAREREIEKYKDRYAGGWDKLREERHARMLRMGLVKKEWGITPRASEIPAWETAANKEWQARRMAVYAAMIDRLDQGIGRVLNALDRIGERDNTLILFLADNGGCAEGMSSQGNSPYDGKTLDGKVVRRGNNPAVMPGPGDVFQSYGPEWAHASNTPFRLYKHWEHEGGISTPLIAHWPAGISRPNRLDHQHGHLIDIMATAVDVAGVEYPKSKDGQAITPLEGKTLRPILEGKRREGHRAVFWEHEGNRAVRMGRHKLVAEYRKPWELYDMETDRTEMRNLAASQPERAAAMEREWQQWADRVGAMDYDTVRKQRPA